METGGTVWQAGLLGCGPPKDCEGRQALQGRRGPSARLVLNGQLLALGRRPQGSAQLLPLAVLQSGFSHCSCPTPPPSSFPWLLVSQLFQFHLIPCFFSQPQLTAYLSPLPIPLVTFSILSYLLTYHSMSPCLSPSCPILLCPSLPPQFSLPFSPPALSLPVLSPHLSISSPLLGLVLALTV